MNEISREYGVLYLMKVEQRYWKSDKQTDQETGRESGEGKKRERDRERDRDREREREKERVQERRRERVFCFFRQRMRREHVKILIKIVLTEYTMILRN